ncbi:MAG TPA: DUF3658 domain-containing protein [Chitinispirillaceae bacterium]|nr:DUF3658 domain-containing protein [Chitinispirillaceae bacterium]
MIELAFSESAAGSLKLAKSSRLSSRKCDQVISVGGAHEEKNQDEKSDVRSEVTIEISPMDVEALTLSLDIGDISDMDTGINPRQKIIEELFTAFPGVPDAIIQTNLHVLARLQQVKETMEHIRMWVCSTNPSELCGLYYVCSILANAKTTLSVVRVPDLIEKNNGIINYRDVGEIIPETLGALTVYEEPVSQLRCRFYANSWIELVNENAPLRAIVNGNVIGVPKDFFDFALRANMPEGEFIVAKLIGKTLGQLSGVGDRWLYLRIQAMLESGELVQVSAPTDDHPYSGVVKRK